MSGPRRGFAELPPQVVAEPRVRAAAGLPVTTRVLVTNRAAAPRVMSVTPVGLDAAWMPRPIRTRPVLPGHTVAVELTFVPAPGTVAADYPLSIAVQAIDPLRRAPTATTAIAETSLVVDASGQIGLEITPAETTAYRAQRMAVVVHNTGIAPEDVHLDVRSVEVARVTLSTDLVHVPPGASVRVPGRIRITPRMFGRRERYGYTVTARGAAAPRRAEAAVTSKAFCGHNATKFWTIILLCALWGGLAIAFIPKIGSAIENSGNKAADKAARAVAASTSATPSTAGSGSQSATSIQLAGNVIGQAPGNVHVGISPTSLVDEAAQAATPVGVDDAAFHTLGKSPQQDVQLSAPSAAAQTRATMSQHDGSWAIGGVKAPGYYLLVFAKPGYQTQRYVVDSSSTAATQPITVDLVPGQGELSGHIYGPGGRPVGASKITITDGINSITTSSNSRGDVGGWAVTGLSTPDSYVVTASEDGLSTETALTSLPAGGSAVVNLTLKSGVGSLLGRVIGPDSLGAVVGLGGAQVTATNGTITRTASTITAAATVNSDVAGHFTLPDLPPGTYTLTTTDSGYLSQSQPVTIPNGASGVTIPTIALTPATSSVSGRVHDPNNAGINGAGLILSNARNTYKITSGSDGSFRLDGVAPGTYALSAQEAGYTTVFATVTVNPGQTVEVPASALTLKPDVQLPDNSITGFVASAVSPSGTLTCPAAAVSASNPCRISISLADNSGNPILISTTKIGPYSSTLTIKPSVSGPSGYTIYGETGAGAPTGAGQYTITVKAPGFLTTVLNVKVPFTGQAQAPQANLFPTNTLTGTINALGGGTGLNHDGPPTGHQNFTNCVWAFPSAQAPATPPTTCSFTPPATSVCNDSGQPQTGFAVIDDSGNYNIPGLCDGTYTVYVVVTNPWYLNNVSPVTETFTHGQTLTYSPTVQRLGRIVLTLPSNVTSSWTGNADCGGRTATLASLQNNTLTMEGIPAGSVTCSVDVSDPNGIAYGAAPLTVIVSNNQDNTATVNLTEGIYYWFGQIVSPYGASAVSPVPNATITVAGTFFGGPGTTSPETIAYQLATNDKGCFEATAGGPPPIPASSPCFASFSGIPPVILPLASRTVTVVISAPGIPTTTKQVSVSGGGNTIVVDPTPIDTSALGVVVPAGTDMSTVSVTATPVHATGAGQVTVALGPTLAFSGQLGAALNWNDSNIGQPYSAWPGTYTVTASAPGLTTVTRTVTCPFGGTSCTFDHPLRLTAQPVAPALVKAALGTTTQFASTNGTTTAYPTQPLAGASVLAAPCTGSTAATCPSLNAAALPSGTVKATANSAGQLVTSNGSTLKPGYYTMKVASFGYATQIYGAPTGTTAPIKVGAGSTSHAATLTQTPVTFKVGINTGGGALLTCPATNPHCATVTLHHVDTNQADLTSDTQDSNHDYVFANIDPATYVITVQGAGLRTTSAQYTVPLGDATHEPPPFVLTVSPVQVAAPKAAAPAPSASPHAVSVSVATTADGDDLSASTVSLTSASKPGTVLTPNPATSTPNAAPAHGSVATWSFTGVPAGSWQLAIILPAGHLGSLAVKSGPALTCSAGTATAPAKCNTSSSNPLVVGTADVSARYSADEYQVGLEVTSKKLAGDPNATPPGTVALSVTDGTSTVYANGTFAVDGGSATGAFWGATGSTYTATVALTGLPPNWQPQVQTYSAAQPNAALALTEVGTTVQIAVARVPAFAGTGTLTLTAPDGGSYSQTASVISGGTATFTGVPLASGEYTATLSGSVTVAGVDKTLGGSVPVAVASTGTVTAALTPTAS